MGARVSSVDECRPRGSTFVGYGERDGADLTSRFRRAYEGRTKAKDIVGRGGRKRQSGERKMLHKTLIGSTGAQPW